MFRIESDAAWRTTCTSDVWSPDVGVGDAWVSYKLVDENDGNIASGAGDAVRIYGRARVHETVRIYSVVLAPSNAVTKPMARQPATWRRDMAP